MGYAATGTAQEEQVPDLKPTANRMSWGNLDYRGNSWVTNMDVPCTTLMGLQGRHLSINASHGTYFDQKKMEWQWQRPALWMTREDIFTMSFVVPYLMPMLEHAGAYVWTARERCWMREEVIVDNDAPRQQGEYKEHVGEHVWNGYQQGFAWLRQTYKDGQNPFLEGSARFAEAQRSKRNLSRVTYTPSLPKDGQYAVYVSYPNLATNVPDVEYTVRHRGVDTHFRVNQQMGGGTWVYLGTFDFAQGAPSDNHVMITNHSNYRGTVSTDAVRFGGGMGNIVRSDTLGFNPILSGQPRYLEGARYSMQWAGLPYEVYSDKRSSWDYGDDICTRGLATNYVARGSNFLPGDSGLCVPIELCLAIHSDAGYTEDTTLVGSLSLQTTHFENGFYPTGLSRKSINTFTQMLLDESTREISKYFRPWVVRGIWDKSYGETRLPAIPSAIFEMFSHQNFADIKLGHDPNFKFHLSRSIYKSVLRYVNLLHGRKGMAVVQPLPIEDFVAEADALDNRIKLYWKPVIDPLEPTAKATSFIVYKKENDGGWDNGTETNNTHFTIDAREGVLYQFKVEAVNAGGRSLPSEELCAYICEGRKAHNILIVNGFNRLAAPYSFENDSCCGFRMDIDPGVPFMSTPEYCGPQIAFNKSYIGKEVDNGLGVSSMEWIGLLMKGNTFDYPTLHARDMIQSRTDVNISSCSRKALENKRLELVKFGLLDLILGAQRSDGYSPFDFKTFTPGIKDALKTIARHGGSILCSGAYTGTDMTNVQDMSFTREVLHWEAGQPVTESSLLHIKGNDINCTFLMQPNEAHLHTRFVSELKACGQAFTNLIYEHTGRGASVAYSGQDYACITMGFPFEHIQEELSRRQLMQGYLQFLLR